LERTVEKLGGRPHANVVRIDALETIGGASFSYWNGPRARRWSTYCVPGGNWMVQEVIALMGSIASGIDHALASGIEQIDPGLHHIHVTFPQKPPEDWLKLPVTEWPPNAVKVNPLSFRAAVAAAGTWAGGGETVVERPAAGSGSAAARGVRSLAAIVYELLGGKLAHAAISETEFEYKPLATLGEAGNEILRRAFSPDPPFSAAKSFANALADPANADLPRHTQSTLSPTRTSASATTTSPIGRPEISVGQPPAPAKSKWPVILVAMVALGGAGAWYALKKPPTISIVNPTPDPGGGSVTVTPVPEKTTDVPLPDKDKPLIPSRKEMLTKAVAEASELEKKQAWREAVMAYLQIARDYPESEAGKAYLGAICNELRARPHGF
jgi:hypothetical protein